MKHAICQRREFKIFQCNMIWNLIHAIIQMNTSDLFCSKKSFGNGERDLIILILLFSIIY